MGGRSSDNVERIVHRRHEQVQAALANFQRRQHDALSEAEDIIALVDEAIKDLPDKLH